jgi:hypothetical protein
MVEYKRLSHTINQKNKKTMLNSTFFNFISLLIKYPTVTNIYARLCYFSYSTRKLSLSTFTESL